LDSQTHTKKLGSTRNAGNSSPSSAHLHIEFNVKESHIFSLFSQNHCCSFGVAACKGRLLCQLDFLQISWTFYNWLSLAYALPTTGAIFKLAELSTTSENSDLKVMQLSEFAWLTDLQQSFLVSLSGPGHS
jgi:hypothetical protein